MDHFKYSDITAPYIKIYKAENIDLLIIRVIWRYTNQHLIKQHTQKIPINWLAMPRSFQHLRC